MNHKALDKHFEYLHKNQPAPFNPDFKPHAKECWEKAVGDATHEEEKDQTVWTREKRALRRRENYDQLMRDYTK